MVLRYVIAPQQVHGIINGYDGIEGMTLRPALLCKFRSWKITGDRDPNTGEYQEHHRSREMLLNAQFYSQPPRFFDDPHDAQQGAKATGSPRDMDKFIIHDIGVEVN